MITWIEDDITIEVNNLFDIAQRHIQQNRYITGNTLEIPNVRYRRSELNKAHAMATHPTFSDLHTATLTNNAAVTDPLVLATVAFPIFGGTKDFFAEQPVHLRLQRAVINGLRFGDLTDHLAVRKGALPPLHHPFG